MIEKKRKFNVIPTKEHIEEAIDRKSPKPKVIETIVEKKESSNTGMTWQEFPWGSDKGISKTSPKNEVIENVVSTEVPLGKDIIANGFESISSSISSIYYNFLEALVPYWGYIEVVIAFHLTLLLIVLVAIDIIIILKILLLLKTVVKLILQLFGKDE